MKNRRITTHEFRYHAADVAYNRPHPIQRSNGEENRYRVKKVVNGKPKNFPSYIAAFTKGFEHDVNGFIVNPEDGDYSDFIRACDSGDLADIKALKLFDRKPGVLGKDWRSNIALVVAKGADGSAGAGVRAWESMGAGLVYDLEGPDAQALAIPPAPTLDSDELTAEIAELYWMALLRDVPFTQFEGGAGSDPDNNSSLANAVSDLNSLAWFRVKSNYGLHPYETARKRGYFADSANPDNAFSLKNIFRGNVKGDDIGPHISQFLYVGNKSKGISNASFGPNQGLIAYGSATIDQRVRIAQPGVDYMTNWAQWLDVQNGANLRELEEYDDTDADTVLNINREKGYRFICTPRDLCTYVHYDALHQAYFNACLIMLGHDVPFDPDLPFQLPDSTDKQTGFAQFGPPHILNLVSEVATRALKAVRFQKYNVHRRVRPEVMGGWIHQYANGPTEGLDSVEKMVKTFKGHGGAMPVPAKNLWAALKLHNQKQNLNPDRLADPLATANTYLLPMPFAEGSPMHPSYGSGHATVAGACVTILKAFFDEGYILPFAYEPGNNGKNLRRIPALENTLTVENELNKLAANIAFGRNWSGVHYWSDQIESMRLGEQIALGILEEQKLQYGENFSMTVPLFDGTSVRI